MEIKKICVLGAGIMGAGIAQIAAMAGFNVSIRLIFFRVNSPQLAAFLIKNK